MLSPFDKNTRWIGFNEIKNGWLNDSRDTPVETKRIIFHFANLFQRFTSVHNDNVYYTIT